MTSRKLFSLVLSGMLATAGAARAAQPPQGHPPLTLEQAIERVQQETGGRILSADPRQYGRRTEYRIKVLTPEGHVRVISITSDAARGAVEGPGKRGAGNGARNKETH